MGMTKEVVVLIADDDLGHVRLIEKNLSRAGLHNPIERFDNGQDILDFLFGRGARGGGPRKPPTCSCSISACQKSMASKCSGRSSRTRS